MINPKRLVRGAFESADLPRLPFIPWIFTHAARLEQIPVRRMFADPTQYTRCLHNAQKLYGYDAIVSSFDSSLEMEICGCTMNWKGDYEAPAARPNPEFDFDRLKDINVEAAGKTGRFCTVIESLRRINSVAGQNLALVGVIHGPLTLIAGITGRDPIKDLAERPEETSRALEAAAGFLLKIVQIYCRLELDVIAIVERPIVFCPPDQLPQLQAIYSPIVNTVRFYNAFSVLLPGESATNKITGLLDFGFDGIVIPGIEVKTWYEIKGGRSCVLGKAIPVYLLNSGSKEIQTYLEAHLPERIEPGVFLTTDGELPLETPPDNIHLLMKMISQH
jgi:uroporphyrinogen decarboxylase